MKLSLLKIKRTCETLLGASAKTEKRLEPRALEVFDHKDSNIPPDGEYLPFDLVDDVERRYWVKTDFCTPAGEENCVYYLEVVTGIGGSEAQMIIYLNGKMAQGLDGNHRRVRLMPDTEYNTVCYFYSGQPWAHYPVEFRLIKVNKLVEKLYFDLLVPYEACRDVYREGSAEYCAVLACLEQACNLIDMRTPGSADFLESAEAAIRYMEDEFYGKLCGANGAPTVNCIAHTHIDVEWMWDRRQTREKMQRSVSTALALMEEYPEYRFMLSQPELYRYLKEEAPEKYEELREYAAKGRWEADGALYLECDCNLISGESMVRQLLYGKKFFSDEFGVDSRVCFLPDVFGYSAAMPQILKKAEVDYFVTSKISWNDTNTMPYDAFVWQGIDGSEIFSAFITGQQYPKTGEHKRRTAYGSGLDPSFVKGAWERFAQKEYCTGALHTFGHGDGGGGPTYQMLEEARRLEKGLPGMPRVRLNLLRPTLEAMEAEFLESANKLRHTPRWVGELYLELHRGTYTSHAEVKLANRRAEFALGALEALSVTDSCFGGDYDSAGLMSVWKKVLHNQFHDILPGSSINSVYKLVAKDYEEIFEYTDSETSKKLTSLAGKIATDGGILVYNSLGFARSGEITLDSVTVNTGRAIPAFGYAVIPAPVCENRVILGDRTAENDLYRLVIDDAGRIVSLWDKKADREVVLDGRAANEFCVYEDYPDDHDAWDLEEYTERKEYKLDSPATVTPVTDGERAGFKIKRAYQDSFIEQTIWLYSRSPRIDLEHRINWQQNHQLLKLAFPMNLRADSVKCEIQFGHIDRPTHRNTSWDGAKFEICAHKWVDVSEYGYGVALLNDCKYGHSVEGSTVKLTCIKCPTEPDAEADLGEHRFTCSILPHEGDFAKAGVIREAYALNQPLMAMPIAKNAGTLPEEFSLVSCDSDAVVIDTVKKAEESDDVIVRLYESFGGSARCTLNFADRFGSVTRTNLMERDEEPLEAENGSVRLSLKPFEIVTLRLSKYI